MKVILICLIQLSDSVNPVYEITNRSTVNGMVKNIMMFDFFTNYVHNQSFI